jgi:hypothetical protein
MCAWNKVYPTATGVAISASVDQIRQNWIAMEDCLAEEHESLDSALSGTHLYGRVSAMASGTYATIYGLSNPATGAIAFDTQCGVCRIYTGSTWPRITGSKFSRAHIYSASSQAITPLTWTQVVLASESYDSLSEAANSSITVVAAGWYLVIGTITWTAETINDYQKVAGIYVGSTRVATDTKYGHEEIETEVMDIVELSASNSVKLRAYHTHTSNVNIIAANLILTRLS